VTKRLTLGLAAAVLASAAAAAELAAQAAATKDSGITLSFKPPSFKVRYPKLQLQGAAPVLPDGTRVKINLFRLEESYVLGGKIEGIFAPAGGGLADVNDKKFAYEAGITGAGKYMVEVLYLDDIQSQEISDQLKKKLPQKVWQFEFLCWGDDLAPELPAKLKELQTVGNEVLDMVKRFEAACKSEEVWKAEGKAIVKDNGKLLPKVENSTLRNYYPAAMIQMFYTIRNLQGTAQYFHFEKGQFAGGRSYHADNQEIKTYREEAFNFANLKRYVEEAIVVAGREYCLWIIKEMRRTGGPMKEELLAVLKNAKDYPGIPPFAERLEKAGLSDIDALEIEIRGGGKSDKGGAPAAPPGK
jgi:hypothetical protein